MATNTFNNIADITPRVLDVLENNLTFTKHVNRGYDDRFRETGGKIGDTANIRVPGFYTVRTGKVASPQGYNDTYVPVTLTQKGVDLQFSSKELRLNVDDFMENVLTPMIVPLANQIDLDGLSQYTSIYQAAGTPGTAPTDLSSILDANAYLDEMAVPRDDNRACILAPRSQSSIINGLKTLFNPQMDIAEQYRSGNMGRIAAGNKFSMDQNAPTHTVGTFGTSTPLMNGTTADGATQIVTNGWASGASALKKGDIVSIAGVYAVNPVSKSSTGQLKQFVVTEDVSDTSGDMTIKISPAITLTGPLQNVTAVPLTTAKVYVWGANANTYSAKVSPVNMVFHKDAFLLATADLPKVGPTELCSRVRSKKLDISIRMVKFYNGSTDDELYRLDVLYGWTVLRPTFAVRVQG